MAYLALARQRSSWASRILLLDRLGEMEMPFALAGLIAGALVLALGADAVAQRGALRAGAYDFLVNDLDEAVRVLKNEARRGSPVSIGLEGDPMTHRLSMSRRGLTPTLVVQDTLEFEKARGADVGNAVVWSVSSPARLTELSGADASRIHCYAFADRRSRDRFDERVAQEVAPGNSVLEGWIRLAPRVLPRFRLPQRFLYLAPDEAARLTSG